MLSFCPSPAKKHGAYLEKRFDVAIAGEINLDLVLDGIAEAMPVERELLASDCRVTLGSSAAILAHNCAALGLRVSFASLAANDMFGAKALEFLGAQGVDLSQVRTSQSDTGSGLTVVVNHGGARHILSYLGTTAELSHEHLDLDHLCTAKHFHLSSLFLLKRLQSDLPDLFRAIKARGLTISLDTNDDPDDRWQGVLDALLPLVDVLLPNERELLRIAKKDSVDDALQALSGTVKLIAVKRGARGASVQQGSERHDIPAIAVTPADLIGAGDSFNAGFLSGYVRGLGAAECARLGNLTGAISTLKPGGIEAFRDREFLAATLARLDPAATHLVAK
jgi:sugar/nucleoside kinase (ribokinase family)